MSQNAFRSYGPLLMKIDSLKRCLLSKLNSFDQNFMKLGTVMSSSSSIMVHIAPCFLELLPFVHEKSPFLWGLVSFDHNFMKLVHNV